MDIGAVIGGIIASPFICIGWIIVGAVAGGLARQITGSKDRPFLNDLILGLVGAVVGGFIMSLLDIGRPDGGLSAFIVTLIVATLGAVVLIVIGRVVLRKG
ncbi:MAG: GlsB/YeaQ/YmgE family stress response membrane protein [Chloroflexi bacterium]|nr:GlsB/YeaQ/YmgE family stress response membrane protein [Chloroflexota bacterium]